MRGTEQVVLTAVSRNQAADTLVLDFSSPGLGDSKFLLLSTWILVSAAAPKTHVALVGYLNLLGPQLG